MGSVFKRNPNLALVPLTWKVPWLLREGEDSDGEKASAFSDSRAGS